MYSLFAYSFGIKQELGLYTSKWTLISLRTIAGLLMQQRMNAIQKAQRSVYPVHRG